MNLLSKEETLALLAKCVGTLSVTYSRPHNKGILEKKVTMSASELAKEIEQRFSEERMEGRDFIVFLPEIGRNLVGNHDGQLFLQ